MNYIGHKSSRIGKRCSIPSLVRFHYSLSFGTCVGTQTEAMDGPTGKDRRAMDRGMDAIGTEARINSTDATRQGGSRPSAPAATIGHSIGAALHICLSLLPKPGLIVPPLTGLYGQELAARVAAGVSLTSPAAGHK